MFRKKNTEYEIVLDKSDFLLIADQSEIYGCKSVTNGAEEVVEQLLPVLKGRVLFYIDTEERVDQLEYNEEGFTNFAPGYRSLSEFLEKRSK